MCLIGNCQGNSLPMAIQRKTEFAQLLPDEKEDIAVCVTTDEAKLSDESIVLSQNLGCSQDGTTGQS